MEAYRKIDEDSVVSYISAKVNVGEKSVIQGNIQKNDENRKTNEDSGLEESFVEINLDGNDVVQDNNLKKDDSKSVTIDLDSDVLMCRPLCTKKICCKSFIMYASVLGVLCLIIPIVHYFAD